MLLETLLYEQVYNKTAFLLVLHILENHKTIKKIILNTITALQTDIKNTTW